MLIPADLPYLLTRGFDLLFPRQFAWKREFHFVVERAVGTLASIGLNPKLARISSSPPRHISTLRVG